MSDAAQGIPWGTQWDLVAAADESVDWSAFLVTLGFQDERAGGKAPVNRYFGMCAAGPEGGLALGPFGMTMMAGPPEAMAAEASYVAAARAGPGIQARRGAPGASRCRRRGSARVRPLGGPGVGPR